MPHPLHLTDAELVARLTQTEDSFVERKSQSDKSGWLRTTVAFANSTPVGLPSVLFIGASDDGQISANVDVEKTLQAFSDHIGAHAWPPIFTTARELTHAGRSCVAVIVPGSAERPHFAGRAYVREGTQTKDASAAQFTTLIASRNSKARAIISSIGKAVTWTNKRAVHHGNYEEGNSLAFVVDCTPHYVTVRHSTPRDPEVSIPLSAFEVGFDRKNERLQLFYYSDR
jgi:hypothetical protein